MIEYTEEMKHEFMRCSGFLYFLGAHIAKAEMIDPRLLDLMDKKVVNLGDKRASYRSTLICAYALWLSIFNHDNVSLIITHDDKAAKSLKEDLMQMYWKLPEYMRPKTVYDNRHHVEFDNYSKVYFERASAISGKGRSVNLLAIDNFELIGKKVLEVLAANLIPCLAATHSKLITTGTGFGEMYE